MSNKHIFIGQFKSAKEAGLAYDKYVINNNLEHTTNGLAIKLKHEELQIGDEWYTMGELENTMAYIKQDRWLWAGLKDNK